MRMFLTMTKFLVAVFAIFINLQQLRVMEVKDVGVLSTDIQTTLYFGQGGKYSGKDRIIIDGDKSKFFEHAMRTRSGILLMIPPEFNARYW